MFQWNVTSFPAVCENVEKINERVIQAIWNYLFLRVSELKTTRGIPVQILDQGSWNNGAGPDFLGAKLRLGETVRMGNVEIHHRTSDWRRHGHDGDPLYASVILHVVMDHDAEDDGRPVMEMRPFLADRLENLIERLRDLERQNIFCHDDLDSVDDAIVRTWIQDNGWQRFLRKADEFRIEHDRLGRPWDSIIYDGVFEALGYSANRAPFRRLAQLVPFDRLRQDWPDEPASRLMWVQATLLGVAGLLQAEVETTENEELVPFVNRLQSVWSLTSRRFKKTMGPSDWKLNRLRPANFPTLRIAGLSKLLSVHGSNILSIFDDAVSGSDNPSSAWRKAVKLLHVPSYGYWTRHYRLNDRACRQAHDLIGTQRASEIILNVVLPALHARGADREKARVREILYAASSPEDNTLIREMKRQLKFRRPSLSLVEGQGLIQLHRRCREMACADCPVFDELVSDD